MVGGFGPRAYGFLLAHIKPEAFPYGLRAYENSMVLGVFVRGAYENSGGVRDFGALAI